jgi:hypothetical protein
VQRKCNVAARISVGFRRSYPDQSSGFSDDARPLIGDESRLCLLREQEVTDSNPVAQTIEGDHINRNPVIT